MLEDVLSLALNLTFRVTFFLVFDDKIACKIYIAENISSKDTAVLQLQYAYKS